jgi:pimeloyl-ACP methyl ester carboxylesterase
MERRSTRGRKAALFWAFATLVAAGLIGLTAAGMAYRWIPTLPDGGSGRLIEVEGTRLRVLQVGSGPDLLLIHGSPGLIEDWSPILDRLATRYRVTAYDRPGQGFSEIRGDQYRIERNADVALALIQTLKLHPIVVGHSFGAATALALAIRNRPEVRGYVLVGPLAYEYGKVDPIARLIALPYIGPGIALSLGRWFGPQKFREGIQQRFAPNEERIPPGFIDLRIGVWTEPKVLVTLSQERVARDASLRRISPHYPEIRGKVSILHGVDDADLLDGARRLGREIPNARLRVFEKTGHFVQFARPDDVVAAIDTVAESR